MYNQTTTYEELKKKLRQYRYTHNLSGKYYGSLYQRLTIPTIIITGLVSMGGFLASSEIISKDVKNGFTIAVGVLGSISTIIQSILHSCEYATKKKMFEQAADEYDKLMTKLDFIYSSRTSGTQENENMLERLSEIQEEILKVQTNCIYLPPLFVIEKWKKKYYSELHMEQHLKEHETSQQSYQLGTHQSSQNTQNTQQRVPEKVANTCENIEDFLLTTDAKKSSSPLSCNI